MFKPMLAVDAGKLEALRYPLLASYKIDGIRAVTTADGPRTRSLKPIPNAHIAAKLSALPPGLDGELVVMNVNGTPDFRATTSAVMNRKFEPDFQYMVFDRYDVQAPFMERHDDVRRGEYPSFVKVVPQVTVHKAADVLDLFTDALAFGYEGLILRAANARYKCGRSTLNEQGMLKVKPWEDAEALIVACLPERANNNVAFTSELGRTKRSTAKAGRVDRETLGTLVVRSDRWPRDFEIGTGFTDAEKLAMWADKPIGKLAKFRFVNVGDYDVPRHASFVGIRSPEDL